MIHMRASKVLAVAAFFLTTAASTLASASEPDRADAHRDWGIGAHIRAGGAGLSYGDFLEKGTAWDFAFFKQHKQWRWKCRHRIRRQPLHTGSRTDPA